MHVCVCRGEAFLVLLLKCCCCCSIINYFHIMPVEQWKYNNMCDVAPRPGDSRHIYLFIIYRLNFLSAINPKTRVRWNIHIQMNINITNKYFKCLMFKNDWMILLTGQCQCFFTTITNLSFCSH